MNDKKRKEKISFWSICFAFIWILNGLCQNLDEFDCHFLGNNQCFESSIFFQGKAFRPKLITNMADAVNAHLEVEPDEILEKKQYEVAMISEMYHTSSLYHDDVIDNAEIRYNGAKNL